VPTVSEKQLAPVLEKIRSELAVRPLTPLEDGKPVTSATAGTFGFVSAGFLSINQERGGLLDRAPFRRTAYRSFSFEVSRLANGETLVFAFVSPSDGVRLAHLDGHSVQKVTLSPMPWSQSSTLVLLPLSRFLLAEDREIETDSEGRFTVLDASIR
jgi:hypothetical protein